MKYQWNAEDYKNNSQVQQQWARELIDKLKLGGDEQLLDLGCGDGKVTAELGRHLPQGAVVGVDTSAQMVELATKTFPPARCANVSFKLMDAAELRFDESFDVVFSNAALHWVYDHTPVLQGIWRALRPGGRILLQQGGKGNGAVVHGVFDEWITKEPWQNYFHDFNFRYGFHGAEQYRQWLEGAGFGVKRVELIPKVMRHDDREAFTGWLRTTWLPYIEPLPEETRATFIEQVATRYLQEVPAASDGSVQIDMVRLEVEAVKEA